MELEPTYQGRPLSHAWYANVASVWRHTAASSVPLTVTQDVVEGEDIANRHYDFLSLYIVRQGRGTHVIDGRSYSIARGDVYAMGLGQTHYFTRCESLVTDTLHFSPSVFDAGTLDALAETRGFQSLFVEEPLRRRETSGEGGRWLHLTPDAYAPVEAMVAELRAEWLSGTPDGALLTRGLFLRLLVHLARAYAAGGPPPRPSSSGAADATVAAAVRYLDAHFAEPLRISEVAASVFLSPDRFTEVFGAVMGRTPRDYLGHLRLERAKRLLAETALSISEVAQQSGFGESAYFARTFRAATGMTPRAWRGQTRK